MKKEEKKTKEIPVVFATDVNYLFFTCVAITSIAKSAREGTFYQIYILTSLDYKEGKYLFDLVQQRYNNIHIEIVRVDDYLFKDVKINNSQVTKATFYRLVLCNLLKEEKCIYLDSDIIVSDDLKELYQTELGDNYLAGSRDIWMDMLSEEELEKRRVATKIPSLAQYVNAGVLLFNLRKMREDGIDKLFIEQMSKNYPHEDQDILNVCCYGKIQLLPSKWNLLTAFMGQIKQMEKAGIKEEILVDFRSRRGIYHYATAQVRPWERENCWLGKEWWQIAKEWEMEAAYQEIRNGIYRKEMESGWDYYRRICCQNNKVVICGYTNYGKELCNWIKNIEGVSKIVFCDNNEMKQGELYQGIPVLSFEEIFQRETENLLLPLFIIASQTRAKEVQEFLLEKGIPKKQIVVYRRKDESYYMYLDDRYYRIELQDICKKENLEWGVFKRLSMSEIRYKLKKDKEFEKWIRKYYLYRWLLKE